jgi:hypothetical protein
MKTSTEHALAKVPEVTLGFWLIKIAATTLGETGGGDAVSMSMNLGYLVGTAIFAAIFLAAVVAQVKAKDFHPFLYWTTIIATTTVGTTLADFADRSLGIGYAGGSSLLLALLLGSLFVWHRTLGSVSVSTVSSPKAEAFYWLTIMFSQTLGTALGDWTADTAGLGWDTRVRPSCSAAARAGRGSLLLDERVPHAAVLGGVHPDAPAGCRGRRFSGQAAERGRLALSRYSASAALLTFMWWQSCCSGSEPPGRRIEQQLKEGNAGIAGRRRSHDR